MAGENDDSKCYASMPYRKMIRKGVIHEWEDSIDELEAELMPGQGTYKLERLKKRTYKNGEVKWTEGRAILITFEGDSLPTKMLIGYGHVWLRVEPFVESVKQCYKCYTFEHSQQMCRNKVSNCRRCGEERHGECNKQPHCTNCAGAHPSMSKECPIFQKEANIKKVMAYRNWPYNTVKTYIEAKSHNENMETTRRESKQGRWEFPPLQSRPKIEYWEDKEVPRLTFKVNKWNESQEKGKRQEKPRNQGYIDLGNEEQELMNRNKDIVDRKKKRKREKQEINTWIIMSIRLHILISMAPFYNMN
ncbi:uncharacterized protein LOC128888059 [Hylaeus anthracinus]|uniref:uncharacterized protein LOC128888059 n=1 Tax=Hylaeus anthracinus TaxID=313031 RepID=UPI0023B9AEB1|nr:uncharacterized protein LOC128888059 [Hylaeus anthracinus]